MSWKGRGLWDSVFVVPVMPAAARNAAFVETLKGSTTMGNVATAVKAEAINSLAINAGKDFQVPMRERCT
eukprot:symbB.v1.2.022307.t1/scaffold1973.1/size94122/11